ncbi:SDR family NAD(P)-dependent oxidoreductase [Streptomyces albidoflavus]
MSKQPRNAGVAIVGIGCRFPGADDPGEFLANLTDGVDAVREIPADRFDTSRLYDPDRSAEGRSVSKWCGLVERPYDFDHQFFRIAPREARLLDPLQRLLMEVTQACVEDAGTTVAALGASRTSVYIGNMERDHMAELTRPGHTVESHSVLGVYDCLLANRLSQVFGLGGASMAVDAACASSLVAVHLGMQALATGEADHVLAGGVNLNLHPWKYVGFSKSRMLSPTGRCRTFDRDADGFVPGDGVGMVLLRRLEDAVRDGDHIYGVLRGSAVNHGRRRATITAPTVGSQREVVSEAVARAGVSPADITFVETHGTGTSLGDPIEVEALRQVFAPASDGVGWCTLGAVKSNIGHLEGAAGVAGLIKVLMMMSERRIVPNLHLRTLNPLIRLAGSPFRLAAENTPWRPSAPGRPRLAGVSSFGFGGVNAHLVVEEYVPATRPPQPVRPLPFLLSAASASSLEKLTGQWRRCAPQGALPDVCTTLAVGRTQLPHRIGGVVTGSEDIAALLAAGEESAVAPEGPWALRVGLLEVPDDVEAFVSAYARVLDAPVADLLRTAEVGGARQRFAYTTAVVSALLRLGLTPDRVLASGPGVWPALAALGALDAGTAADLADGRAVHGTLRAPSLPLAVPGTDRVVVPFALDTAYLADLRGATVDGTELAGLAELAGRLDAQRTYQHNVADWRRALRERGYVDELVERAEAVESVGATGPDGTTGPAGAADPRVAALAWQNALDRLSRKWGLPLDRQLADARAVELLDLLLDGVVEPGDVIGLLAGESVAPRRPERAEMADQNRYPVLRGRSGLPDELAGVEAWVGFADAAGDAVGPAGSAGSGGVVPEGHSVVSVGEAAGDVRVVSGADPLTEPLTELWRRGVDVRWADHPVATAGVRTPLPTTRFDSVEHRVPSAVEAVPPDAPGVPAAAVPRAAGAEAAGGAVGQQPAVAAAAVGESAVGGTVIEESAVEESVVELRAEWEATGRVAAPAVASVLVLGVSGADVGRLAAACLPGRVRTVEQAALPGADDLAGWRRTLGDGTPPDAVVLCCTGSATDTAVAALRVTHAVYGRGTRVLAVGPLVGGAVSPELAALTGLARSLARETRSVPFRAMAVAGGLDTRAAWESVADELGRSDGTELVRYAEDGRLTRRYVPAPPSPATPGVPGVRPGGVYLLTGGTGGVGQLVAEHLLSVPGVRVAVVGRSPASQEDGRERVAHFVADVSDAEQARTVVRRVRERFGALTGVLHAAGVLRDGYLAQKSADDLRAVFAPKVLGAVNLDRATRDEPLEMFVLFSSMVASVGNPGQADYAAANAFLDQFAEVRETLRAVGERSGRSLSIGWPVWRDGGMTVTDRGVLGPGAGVLPMPTATALAVLDRLLAGATGARPFVHGVPHRVPELLDPVPAPGTPAAAPNGPGGPDAGPAPEADRAQLVAWAKEHVADVIGELRGVAATDVDLGRSLDQYGLDSIVISEFNARTEARIGSVGETLLFESRTLAAAAERIAQLRPTELTALYGAADAPVGESDAEVVGASSGEVTEGAGSRSADVAYDDTTAYDDIADDDVAVIGLAGRYPHAPDLDSFWDNLLRGRDSVARVPRSRWTPSSGTYCEEGAFLDDVYAFDPLFFNISPRDAELMDPQERLFLQTAWHAFEDAGYPPGRLGDPGVPGARSVGVFVGVTTQTHLLWGPEQQRAGHPVVPPSPQWSVANRVSYWLDLHGPSMPVDTACASSLTAVHLAARSMARGECRMALVGGVNLYLHPAKYDWLCSLQMLSRTGRCHTFGAGADGFVPGEGVGAALLKPLRAALADGDPIYGVIRGSAVNHGGRTNGYTVPSPLAQAEVVSAALARARVAPATVGYIEAHGTGTALGDPVEIAGLARAFAGVPAGSCRIGSVKTNVGHLESAAGMAGLTKVLLQLESGTLVPSLHSTEPNPRIDFAATPFTVQREVADWPGAGPNGAPRRAGISAFGAGGANAHVVVEEAPRRRWPRGAEHGEHLVVVSAYDRERLAEHCANLSGAIRARADELRVSEIAYQLQVRREPQAERLALLVGDARELADRLAEFAAGREPAGEHWTTVRDRATRTRLREGLPQALARRHWAALAGAWVAGAEVAWESLHDAPGPHVRLPGYPFAREQCRLPEVPPATATVAAASTAVTAPPGGRAAVHPWVREPSGEGGTVELTCDEAAVAQHTVDGTPVFPAAGCVELVRAAARAEVGAGRLVRLRNNVWSAPISVPEPRTLRVSLSGGDPGDYEITGPEGTHVRGKVETAPAEDLPPLDVAAIRARCARTTSGQSLYAAVRARGLDLGPFYQGVERLHWNEGGDEALAELRLPDGGDGGDGGLVLHPGLLDSAFQSSLWLLGQRFDGLYLPFSIGTVEILGELPAVAVAHVVVRRASAEGCKLEVRLADTSGRVVLRALDFWVRARPGGPAWSRFCPAWVAQEAGAVRVPQSAVNVPGSALILAPTDEAGARLGAELSRQAGAPVPVTVAVPRRDGSGAGPLRPRPDSDADFDALLAAAGPVDTVLFAWPRAAKGGVEAQLADGLLPLSRLVRALLRSGDNGQVRLVCAVADRVPGYQALGGFLRTLTRESPRVSHVLVAGATAEQLVAETLGAAAGVEVRHRDGVRAVRRWRRSPVETAAASAAPAPTPVPAASVPAVRDGGVYLITGGAGGLGALVAEWLAKSAGARVVLAGRSAEDERVTRVLDRVRAAGGQACYVRADVSTAEGARSAVRASWAAFGAPHGVFHCAGVLRDGYLVHQDPERLRDVVAAKAIGAVHLDAALADHTPDFLCLFSSVAAAVGSAGQAGYAYANAFLDAFAEQRLGRTLSIAWPLWADGGMGVDAEAAETLRMAFGLRPLATGTGLAALAAELAGDDRQSLIVPGDGAVLARVLDARDGLDGLDGLNATAGAEEHPAAAADDFADTGVDADAVAEAVAEVVVGEMAAVVKLDPLRIDRERPIGDYGFDSLSFTTLANRLVERLGVDFNPALFFEYTTVEDVARHIADAHGAHVAARLSPARPESPKSPESPEPAATAAPAATGTRTSPSRPPASPASLASPAPSVSRADEPVAIIGMHGMLPGSSDLAEFWRNLGAGRDMVTEIPADRWDWRAYYHSTAGPGRTNSKWGGFVPQVDRFDARFFGISPREAELMDPQQRLFLETAYKTVEEAGYRPSDLAKGRTGLFVGAASHDYYELLREAGVPVEAFTTTGMFHAILANRVSYLLGLTGPSLPIDTACSSSLVALRSAVESIRAGSCDTALVGGVNLLLSPTVFISFARAGMLSPTGRCRTFDAGADGYVRAEGVGALLLKPLSAAERDGDHIHAVVRGSAVNHGGKVNTLTTPNPKAQADLIVRAFGEADVDPATVGYLELHGTGTALGDPIEVNGVQRAFAELRDRAGLPPLTAPTTLIGSVKSNIGHLEAAAGLAGIFKVVLSMKHGQIPGNLHLEEVNGQIGLAGSPLSIVDRTMPWPRPQADDGTELPRRAGVSSFGFGGVNGHVLLEEYVAAPADSATTGPQVFVVSARDRERLRAYAGLLARAVRPFDGPRRNAGPEPTAEATAAEAAAAEVTAAELIAAEVAAGLGVDPGDVPWDEPLADLGMSPHRALLLADRLDPAVLPGRRPEALTALTVTELAELAQPAARTSTGADTGTGTDPAGLPSPAGPLADIAYTLQTGREPMAHRLAVVTSSAAELADELAEFAASGTPGPLTRTGVAEGGRGPAAVGGAHELAEGWVTGGTADWAALHAGRSPRRLSLPTYPFARDRHWIPGSAAPGPRPLLEGPGTPDGDGTLYRARLERGDRFVAEHRVHGAPVLAGVVQAELAAAALAAHGGGPRRLTRLAWLRPLVVPEEGCEVLVRLTERDGGIAHELRTADGTVHSTGLWVVGDGAAGTPAPCDLAAVRGRCAEERAREDIYAVFEGIGIRYGELFRGLRHAVVGEGELLARFTAEVSPPYLPTFHPTVLDAALQAVTVLTGAEPGTTRLPFEVESVELLAPVPTTGHVHVRARGGAGHDVTVLDDAGRPCVLLLGVFVREQRQPGLFYRPCWRPAEPVTADSVSAGPVSADPVRGPALIVRSAGSVALADALAARHQGPVHVLDVAEVARPGLAERLRGLGEVRHLWFLALEAEPGEGAQALFRLVRGLAEADLIQRVRSVRSVTSGAQDVWGGRVTDPVAAELTGMSKSLAKEYPRIGVGCVELAGPATGAARAADALLADPLRQDNREVALWGGHRLVRVLRPLHLPPPARQVFREGGSYLIVGGAGGIGLALAEHLTQSVSARIFLVGRRPQDERIERALAGLGRLGGQVTYHQADVTNLDAMRALAAKVRAHGPLHGVVHAAMVLRDGIVERTSEEAFDAVLAPKTDGMRVLGEVFAGDPLDFLLVLSSIQSFTGAAGQANYAAASTAQDAYAHLLAAGSPFPVQHIGFGPWARVGRVADRHESLSARGYRPIEPAEGIDAIERVLAAGERGVVALRADEPVLAAIGAEHGAAAPVPPAVPAHDTDPAEQEALDAFVGQALWHVLGGLGLFTRPGERHLVDNLPELLGARPRHRRLVTALTQVLVRGGHLVRDGAAVALPETGARRAAPDPAPLRARFPHLGARLELVVRCLDALPEVLTGAREATEVVFPGGSPDLVTAVYRGEPLVDYCNALVAGQVVAHAENGVRAGDGVRVLEIGAGTGSTTEAVLAALTEVGRPVEYDVSDISLGLLRQVRARLTGPGVRFRSLDVERPADAQGFAGERYDVVVAGNVLHATRDLDAALERVRGLLAPGGRLVLSEVTVVQPFHTVTFGLLDGWWRFDDARRRLPGSPLLDPHMWRDRLERADFTDVAVLGAPDGPGVLPQRVIVATAADRRPSSAVREVPRSASVAPETSVAPVAPVAPVATGPVVTEPEVAGRGGAQLRALVTERVAGCLGVPVGDVGPDTPLSDLGIDSIVAVELTNQLNDALGVVLKTLVVFEHPTVDALTAHLVERYGETPAPDPVPGPAPVSTPVPGPAPAPAPGAGVRGAGGLRAVRFERPGSPQGLRIVPMEPVAPGPGEIEVHVRAFPINFSDFLLAKGLYPMMPDFPFTPGVEVSGVVRRVGPGVTRFSPGDEVIALTRPEMGGQASVVLTGEDFAVAKPPQVSHEAACGFLVPFLAMHLAFERAGVRAGERVLVPAATGTTGLIAVRLAQLAGAEVIATAGGEHKIAHLAGLGVQEAIDHRRADVVGEVLRRTGGVGVDVVVNTLGDGAAQQGIDVLAPDGRYVEIAVFGLQASTGPDLSRLVDNQSFHSFNTKKFFLRHPERRAEVLRTAAEHLASGRVTPTVAHVLPFDRIAEAYALKEDRALIGRVVVTVPEPGEVSGAGEGSGLGGDCGPGAPSVSERLRAVLAREFGAHTVPGDADLARLAEQLGAGHQEAGPSAP